MELVRARGGDLYEGERRFRFVLVNAFYLHDELAQGHEAAAREVLDACVAMGVRVVRAWAFNDGAHASAIQPERGRLSERGLGALDRLLDLARERGLRLILPLVDFWPAYGGVPQYLRWHGIDPACTARFFREAPLREHYAEHVGQLVARYADDPVVLAWELMNEPRGAGLDGAGEELADWARFAAREVRRHARQLIALGEEGFDVAADDRALWLRLGGALPFAPDGGGSFRRHLQLDELDLATCHWFPEKWGFRRGVEEEAGRRWIELHAAQARAAGKPLLVEEFGLANVALGDRKPRPLAERRRAYAAWLDAAEAAGVAGVGPWGFAHHDRPDGWDAFTFYRHDPPAPIDRYADLVEAAARRIGRIP
jgi:mannan endo-1,4-beta-mannosidase